MTSPNDKMNTTKKSLKNLKLDPSVPEFEVPRQQDDSAKSPEIMHLNASQKSQKPKNNNNCSNPKIVPNEKETANTPPPPAAEGTSAWSWIPSLYSSFFSSSKPSENPGNETHRPHQLQQQTLPMANPQPTSTKKTRERHNGSKEFPKISAFPAPPNSIPTSPTIPGRPDADEKCSRGHGEASPQSSDEGSAKNKSKELIPTLDPKSKKKMEEKTKDTEGTAAGTMISVNLEEGHIADSMLKELIPQPEICMKTEAIPKLNDIFELEAFTTSPGAVTTEPAIKPKCSFDRVSFSRSHTVYFLPNTKQRLHKKVVRSRHDAWRRYGALMVIHKRGGWSYTMNGKAKNFQKVEKGTPLPPAPILPPILTEEEFHKRPIITVPATTKSRRQRQSEKKESKGDTDTSVSDEEPSC